MTTTGEDANCVSSDMGSPRPFRPICVKIVCSRGRQLRIGDAQRDHDDGETDDHQQKLADESQPRAAQPAPREAAERRSTVISLAYGPRHRSPRQEDQRRQRAGGDLEQGHQRRGQTGRGNRLANDQHDHEQQQPEPPPRRAEDVARSALQRVPARPSQWQTQADADRGHTQRSARCGRGRYPSGP